MIRTCSKATALLPTVAVDVYVVETCSELTSLWWQQGLSLGHAKPAPLVQGRESAPLWGTEELSTDVHRGKQPDLGTKRGDQLRSRWMFQR